MAGMEIIENSKGQISNIGGDISTTDGWRHYAPCDGNEKYEMVAGVPALLYN
jgi:hypothetical protein